MQHKKINKIRSVKVRLMQLNPLNAQQQHRVNKSLNFPYITHHANIIPTRTAFQQIREIAEN